MNAAPGAVGPYALIEKVGEGAMGAVFMADQREPIQRRVALKLLKATDDPQDVLRRYEAERQALAGMDHPSIAQVFDAGVTDEGRPYVAMEYIEGTSIVRYCDEKRFTIPERLRLLARVCRAVQHAHRKGVIHRDLKPEHILITEVDGEPLPKLIDFGIAVAIDRVDMAKRDPERAMEVVGTPAYMSPEQINAIQDVDIRTDVYSLGVVLYELLVGATPFDFPAKTGWGAIAAHILSDPPTPTQRFSSFEDTQNTVADQRGTTPEALRRQLHDDLDWVVARAMARDRDERYETAHELAAELERHLTGYPVMAHPGGAFYHARKFARRHRLGVGVAAGAVAGLAAFAAFASVQASRIADARTEAEARRIQAEGLIDFMLNDLRGRLEELGRLDVLDAVGDRALDYFAHVPSASLSDDELASRSQALYQIGEVRMSQGRLDEAGRAFDESLVLARALSERDPSNAEWLFALGQAEFWVGYLNRERGQADAAMAHLLTYRDIADELVRRDPDNPVYWLEVAFGHNNIGVMHHDRFELDAAYTEFMASLAAKERVAAAEPEEPDHRYEVALAHNVLGTLLEDMGRLEEAWTHHETDAGIKDSLVTEYPQDAEYRFRRAVTHHYLAGLAHRVGDLEEAVRRYGVAAAAFEPLVEDDPGNLRWTRALAASRARQAHVMLESGEAAEAERLAQGAVEAMTRVVELNPDQPAWRTDLARARMELGRVLLSRGRRAEGTRHLELAETALRELTAADASPEDQASYAEVQILLGDALSVEGRSERALVLFEQAAARVEGVLAGSAPPEALAAAANAWVRTNRTAEARGALERLEALGYGMPELNELRDRIGAAAH